MELRDEGWDYVCWQGVYKKYKVTDNASTEAAPSRRISKPTISSHHVYGASHGARALRLRRTKPALAELTPATREVSVLPPSSIADGATQSTCSVN
jgi:hypothetical protein